jgi:quinol monooxygenase YgiN
MFGSVFTMKPLAGKEDAVLEHMRQWERTRKPHVAGALASYVFRSRAHPGELVGVAVFDSEANYRKNAEDPSQDTWYRGLRELLVADPAWNDGDVVGMMS